MLYRHASCLYLLLPSAVNPSILRHDDSQADALRCITGWLRQRFASSSHCYASRHRAGACVGAVCSLSQSLTGLIYRRQYRLTVSSTAAVRQFEEAKRQKGSFYAFHGSPLYNWHSILRSSLRNCSDTALMSTGKVRSPLSPVPCSMLGF